MAIASGKLSLADALKQLETVNNAFIRSDRIEKRQVYIDSALHDIQKSLEHFVTNGFLNTKLEEFLSYIQKTIAGKFEEFSSNYLYQLNEKASQGDIQSMVSQRVTWVAFNNYAQQFSSLKTRMEKHILSDFEGFKAKIKLEIASKAEDKKGEEEITVEEFHNMKNRITSLEQKYHEMFVDEGLDDSEEYDSQEAMDNFIEDIDKKDRNSEDGIEGEGQEDEFPEVSRKMALNESPQEVVRSPLALPMNKIVSMVSPDLVSPRSDVNETAKTEVSEETKPDTQKAEGLDQAEKVERIERAERVERVEKSEEVVRVGVAEKAEKVERSEVVERRSIVQEIDTSRAKSRSSIEIDNNESPLKRNRGSSRADNQTLTRKNSMASSMGGNMAGGGVNGGLRQMNKKVMGLQKDLEGYKSSLDQMTINLQDIRDEFVRVYEKIDSVLNRAEEIEVKRQGMEMSFIKALRRAGMDKKQKKTQVSAQIDSAELRRIHEKINRKNKKIKSMTTYVEKAAADIMIMKDKHNGKINEIVKSIKFLDEARTSNVQQIKIVAEEVKKVEKSMKGNIDNVQDQIKTLQGPLTDLISDQQRENEILSSNLKSYQSVLADLVVEISKYKPDVKIPKPSAGSPTLTVKHKLATGFRRTSVPTWKNWLEDIPDGVALNLPRVNLSSHSKKLSY